MQLVEMHEAGRFNKRLRIYVDFSLAPTPVVISENMVRVLLVRNNRAV